MRLRKLAPAFVVVIALGALGSGWYARETSPAGPPGAKPVRVEIPRGASAARVASLLQEKGVVRSAWHTRRLLDGEIVPGRYEFSPSDTPEEIVKKIRRGDVLTSKVTFPEGFTLEKIAARLKDRGLIADPDAFLTLARTGGESFTASFPLPANLEGYVFADTYRFPDGIDDRGILQTMVGAFDRYAAKTLAPRSLHETVTIASLIEREAVGDDDRPLIASVIENRRKKGMRLQIDATVLYARGKHTSRLLYADLSIDSPYNTYRHAGLPPGPICSPGLPSLKAAESPASTGYLYYVLAPDGKRHVFAKTYAEHLKNVAAYRRR